MTTEPKSRIPASLGNFDFVSAPEEYYLLQGDKITIEIFAYLGSFRFNALKYKHVRITKQTDKFFERKFLWFKTSVPIMEMVLEKIFDRYICGICISKKDFGDKKFMTKLINNVLESN